MLPDADIPAFHNRPPAQARAWDLICFSLPRDLENKCDWKASVSHLWLIKLSSLPSFLGAEQDEELKRRNQTYGPALGGEDELGPYCCYCLWWQMLNFLPACQQTRYI